MNVPYKDMDMWATAGKAAPKGKASSKGKADRGDAATAKPPGKPPGKSPGKPPEELPSPADPMAVARKLLGDYQTRDGCLTMRRWRGSWMQRRATHWVDAEETTIRSAIYRRLEKAVYRHVDKEGVVESRPWQPNRRKIADLLDALTAVIHLPEDVTPPTWLDCGGKHEPHPGKSSGEIVACSNGLLDVSTRELHPLTPDYFNRVAVPFAYDPDAPKPARWLKFLAELWPNDADSIQALQEFFGYVLSGRTDLHKILLIVGPTRSGKGTLARVLSALLGSGNVAGPTLASLGTNFGLSPLLSKPLAVISDARLSGANVSQVVERLLSISGEDMLTIDRKYREPWTGTLPSRFLILSNELPRFGDASGAIAHRFVVLSMRNSFLGRENTHLTGELMTELPGILSWSLDGLDRLANSTSGFTEPASSGDAIAALQDLVSPMSAFVRDCCTVAGATGTTDPASLVIPVSDLFAAWRTWCEDSGNRPGTTQTFGRDLRAVVPALRVERPWNDDGKTRAPRQYKGIALSSLHNGTDRGPSRSEAAAKCLDRDRPRSNPLSTELKEDERQEARALRLVQTELGGRVVDEDDDPLPAIAARSYEGKKVHNGQQPKQQPGVT